MGWKNPRWNSLTGPDADALRQIFESLSLFLANPVFNNGIQLGNGGTPSYNPSTDMVAQPSQTPVDSDTLDDIVAGLPPDDGVAPATPCEFVASSGGIRSVYLAWDEAPEDDVKDGWGNYRVQLDDTNSSFGSVVVDEMVGGTQTTITGLQTNKAYYARVAPVDAYGNQGPWNSPVGVTTVQVANADIAAEAVTADKIQANTITANEIAADTITAEELAAISVEVGKHIQSDSYDGTDVATGDATTGWRVEGGGDAEFNDVRVRGDITASRFRTIPGDLLFEDRFDADVTGWSTSGPSAGMLTLSWTSSQGAESSGKGSLQIAKSAGSSLSHGDAYVLSPRFDVTGLEAIQVNYYSYSGASGASVAQVFVGWYDEANTMFQMNLLEQRPGSAFYNDNSFYEISLMSLAAPEQAVEAVLMFAIFGSTSAATTYLDNVSVQAAPSVVGGHFQSSQGWPRVTVPSGARVSLEPDDQANGNRTELPPYLEATYNDGGLTNDGSVGEFRTILYGGLPQDDNLVNPSAITPYLMLVTGNPNGTPSRVQIDGDELRVITPSVVIGDFRATNISGSWTSYNPSNTGLTVGNGTQQASYMVIGKLCFVSYSLTYGSTSSMSGTPLIGLPFPAASAYAFAGEIRDFGTRSWPITASGGAGQDAVINHSESGNGGRVNATNPYTWASGDTLRFSGFYEIA